MSSVFDKNLLPEFDSVKDDDEQIILTEKPKFIPYIFTGLGSSLYLIAFSVVWILGSLNTKHDNDSTGGFFWLFGLLPLLQGLYTFGKKLFSFSNTAYAYSNKRVMMRTGFIGTDFKTIDYDKISDIEVTVNIIERAYNVGSVKFFSGRTESDDNGTRKLYDRWEAISNPYDIFKKVKEVMVDIKTDYNYPNALRPKQSMTGKIRIDLADRKEARNAKQHLPKRGGSVA